MAAGFYFDQSTSCLLEDAKGEPFAEIVLEQGEYRLQCEEDDWAYVDTAFHEAVDFVVLQDQLSEEEAKEQLLEKHAVIRTNYQKEIQSALVEAMNNSGEMAMSASAGAVTDVEGRLLACVSNSAEPDGRNYVIYPTWAGSTMKPLSVYGPALEGGKICWSSKETDSPYMQITNEKGEKEDWPSNIEAYTYETKTAAQALKESNNAITVKLLAKSGVENALNWLEESFQYEVEGERRLLAEKGEAEILDNVALGYLEAGVTMKQMLENYQVFATGGTKTKLCAVDSIQEKDRVLRSKEEKQRVFTEETAYILNRMLKGAVQEGGTAKAAAIEGVDLCGKTGTSDQYRDNWFIGMTPEYLCGIWYSCEMPEWHAQNESVLVAKEVFSKLPQQKGLRFQQPESVEEIPYCARTGLRVGPFCKKTENGYYRSGSFTEICSCKAR